MQKDIKDVHCKQKHTESQDQIVQENQNTELVGNIDGNNSTKWSKALKFIQAMKNNHRNRESNVHLTKLCSCSYETENRKLNCTSEPKH